MAPVDGDVRRGGEEKSGWLTHLVYYLFVAVLATVHRDILVLIKDSLRGRKNDWVCRSSSPYVFGRGAKVLPELRKQRGINFEATCRAHGKVLRLPHVMRIEYRQTSQHAILPRSQDYTRE